VAAHTVAGVKAQVDVIAGHVDECAKAIIAVGVNVNVDAKVQVDIAVKVAGIIAVRSDFAIASVFLTDNVR
jgi:hypothetical protein